MIKSNSISVRQQETHFEKLIRPYWKPVNCAGIDLMKNITNSARRYSGERNEFQVGMEIKIDDGRYEKCERVN